MSYLVRIRHVLPDGRTTVGCAVFIGSGYLTAAHVVRDTAGRLVSEVCLHSRGDATAPVVQDSPLLNYDVAELDLPGGEPEKPEKDLEVSRLDRSREVTLEYLTEDGHRHSVPGTIGSARVAPRGVTRRTWEFELTRPLGFPARGISGCAVLQDGRLVGILSGEDEAGDGKILYVAVLDHWPRLAWGRQPPGTWVEAFPHPWALGGLLNEADSRIHGEREVVRGVGNPVRRPAQVPREREVVLEAMDAPLGSEESGYVVLVGGPQAGKSTLMLQQFQEDWRRSDGTGVLCFFAWRPARTDAFDAAGALSEQLRYLLGEPTEHPARAAEPDRQMPGPADRQEEAGAASLGTAAADPGKETLRLMRKWCAAGRRLRIYLDALDEVLNGASLAFLKGNLPSGAACIVSLRHEPERKKALRGTDYHPCLGWINLDGEDDSEAAIPLSLTPEAVRDSNRRASAAIWADWDQESRDNRGSPSLDSPPVLDDVPGLREAIRRQMEDVVGANGFYARQLRRSVGKGEPLPRPEDVPSRAELIQIEWEFLAEGPERDSRRKALAIIAAARRNLCVTTLQRLLAIGNPRDLDRLLDDAWTVLTRGGDRLASFHTTWSDFVARKMREDHTEEWAECHRLLSSKRMDRWEAGYDFRFRPAHLMAGCRSSSATIGGRRPLVSGSSA